MESTHLKDVYATVLPETLGVNYDFVNEIIMTDVSPTFGFNSVTTWPNKATALRGDTDVPLLTAIKLRPTKSAYYYCR